MSGTQFLFPRGRGWFLVSGIKSFPVASREALQEGPDGGPLGTQGRESLLWLKPCRCLPSPAQPQEGSLSWISARGVIIYVFENVWILEPNYNKNIFKLISTSFWSCQLN